MLLALRSCFQYFDIALISMEMTACATGIIHCQKDFYPGSNGVFSPQNPTQTWPGHHWNAKTPALAIIPQKKRNISSLREVPPHHIRCETTASPRAGPWPGQSWLWPVPVTPPCAGSGRWAAPSPPADGQTPCASAQTAKETGARGAATPGDSSVLLSPRLWVQVSC